MGRILAPRIAGQGKHVADERGHVRCPDRAVVHGDGAVPRQDKGGEEERVVLRPDGVVGGPGAVEAQVVEGDRAVQNDASEDVIEVVAAEVICFCGGCGGGEGGRKGRDCRFSVVARWSGCQAPASFAKKINSIISTSHRPEPELYGVPACLQDSNEVREQADDPE